MANSKPTHKPTEKGRKTVAGVDVVTGTIVLIKVEALKPYELNPYKHDADQLKRIAASIRAFKFNDPIAVDERNEIIEGHGRLEAAVSVLHMDRVPCIYLRGLTEKQKRAYRLAHNKIPELAKPDEDLLRIALQEIDSGDDFDINLDMGFDLTEKWLYGEEDDDGGGGTGARDATEFNLIIQCDSEKEQAKLFSELDGRGLNCRIME